MWHCWTKKYMLALNSHVSQLQHSTECVLSCSIMSNSLWPHGLYPTRLLFPWGFCKQEYWSGLPCPPPGDLPNPRIECESPAFPALQVGSLPLSYQGSPPKCWAFHIIFVYITQMSDLLSRYYYYTHFTDWEARVQSSKKGTVRIWTQVIKF